MDLPANAALLVIDVQEGFDDPRWGKRNNPAMEANVERLISHWRATQRPVVYVRHDSVEADSPLRPDRPGNALKGIVSSEPDLLVTKSVNAAFYGEPNLDDWLRSRDIDAIVVTGIQTNFCCETTARVAGNLGYDTYFVLDATHTFDMEAYDGSTITADELARVTATNLHGEFGTVINTADLL